MEGNGPSKSELGIKDDKSFATSATSKETLGRRIVNRIKQLRNPHSQDRLHTITNTDSTANSNVTDELEEPYKIELNQAELALLSDTESKRETSLLNNEDVIVNSPVFASGSEKRFRLLQTSDGTKKVIAEYKQPVTQDYLDATMAQQFILHALYPDRFVFTIDDAKVGKDGVGRLQIDFVNIDNNKSINVTGPGWSAIDTIQYTARIRNSPEFQALIPELKSIGLLPDDEEEAGAARINELAGNTVYDHSGNQIIIDIQPPVRQVYKDGEKINVPQLKPDHVMQIAQSKGIAEQVRPYVEKYLQAIQTIV